MRRNEILKCKIIIIIYIHVYIMYTYYIYYMYSYYIRIYTEENLDRTRARSRLET
jgi:hypothetical protein